MKPSCEFPCKTRERGSARRGAGGLSTGALCHIPTSGPGGSGLTGTQAQGDSGRMLSEVCFRLSRSAPRVCFTSLGHVSIWGASLVCWGHGASWPAWPGAGAAQEEDQGPPRLAGPAVGLASRAGRGGGPRALRSACTLLELCPTSPRGWKPHEAPGSSAPCTTHPLGFLSFELSVPLSPTQGPAGRPLTAP